jgi:hypothetical protein
VITPFVLIARATRRVHQRIRQQVAGRSLSVALFVTVSKVSFQQSLVFGGSPANTGATFTSVTVTTKLFVTLTTPSLTTVSSVFVLGPCASPGVHVITPFVLMLAPAGGLTSK